MDATKYCTLLILFLALTAGCSKEIVLTEETLPDEIYCPQDCNKPYTGKCVIYYNNSKTVHYAFYFEDGILNGKFTSFFKNGKIEYLGNYEDGELAGEFIKYDENGAVNLTYTFKNYTHRFR